MQKAAQTPEAAVFQRLKIEPNDLLVLILRQPPQPDCLSFPNTPVPPEGLEQYSVSDCYKKNCDQSIKEGGAQSGAQGAQRRTNRGGMRADDGVGNAAHLRPTVAPQSDDRAMLDNLAELVSRLSETQRAALLDLLQRIGERGSE